MGTDKHIAILASDCRVLYMAHPVAGDVHGNARNAVRWLSFLRRSLPDATVIAPWLATVLSGVDDDSDPAMREAGLLDCEAVVARCDGLILCGGRISIGMARELSIAVACDHDVDDLTIDYGPIAPIDPEPDVLDRKRPGTAGRTRKGMRSTSRKIWAGV